MYLIGLPLLLDGRETAGSGTVIEIYHMPVL
jgi:hypothetical protein